MSDDFNTIVRRANSVRVTRVAQFDPRHRNSTPPIAVVSDESGLESLRSSLAVDAESLSRQTALMTPGDVDLNFMRDRDLVVTVTFIYPNLIRCPCQWEFDVQLRSGPQLVDWLSDHGWRAPRHDSSV